MKINMKHLTELEKDIKLLKKTQMYMNNSDHINKRIFREAIGLINWSAPLLHDIFHDKPYITLRTDNNKLKIFVTSLELLYNLAQNVRHYNVQEWMEINYAISILEINFKSFINSSIFMGVVKEMKARNSGEADSNGLPKTERNGSS